MADEKETNIEAEEPILIDGKPLAELSIQEFGAALERGDLDLVQPEEKDVEKLYTMERIDKFIMGEITWAELQGMTMEQAYGIAEYGYGLFQEGKFHDARQIFEGLALSNPYDAYFHNMLGAVYQSLDMQEEALEEYTLAIEMDEEHINSYVNRAEILLQNGHFDRALADLKKAVELDPDGKDPAGLRARALSTATANALEDLKKMFTWAPADEVKAEQGEEPSESDS